jgi:uncharacterized protein
MNFPTKLFMVEQLKSVGYPSRQWALGVLWVFLCLTTPIFAQNEDQLFPPKPEPAVYVHDYAGWLAPEEKNTLEQKLRAYHDSTTTQIVVMIRSDIGDYDKSSYAFELGKRWGIGRADKDNGVVMLVKTAAPERGIFIATGYGTEGALPDITAGRIIRNTMGPYFRAQQYYQGIDAGVNDIIQALSGEFSADQKPMGKGAGILTVLFIALFFFVVVGSIVYRLRKFGQWISQDGSHHAGSRGYHGGGWMGGGWGGGNSDNSGGGWGGGGGSFGGGSFGGGGAGGDW